MTTPATDGRIDAIEAELGVVVPDSLRARYRERDGWWDELAQYWVVWPLERVVEDNRMRWEAGTLPKDLVAFGDDGSGAPFCMAARADAAEVIRWNAIDQEPDGRWPSAAAFDAAWCRPRR